MAKGPQDLEIPNAGDMFDRLDPVRGGRASRNRAMNAR